MERAQAWAECTRQWLQQIKDHSGSEASYRMYNSIVMRFQAFLAGRSLDSVARSDVLAFLAMPSQGARKPGQPVSASTKNVKLSCIQSLYVFASAYEITQADGSLVPLYQRALPTVGLKSLKKDIRPRQMSEDELRRFFAAIPTDTRRGKRDRVLFYAYLILGRRRQELLRLTWGSLQPAIIDGRNSTVYSYTGKGSSRTVRQKEMPPDVYAMICQLLKEEGRFETIKPEDPIFLSSHRPGQPLRGDHVAQTFHKYCLDAGLPVERISLHSLRWSSAYHRAMGGSSVIDVQNALDHQSLSVTSRYLSGMISQHDSAGDKLTRQFAFLR